MAFALGTCTGVTRRVCRDVVPQFDQLRRSSAAPVLSCTTLGPIKPLISAQPRVCSLSTGWQCVTGGGAFRHQLYPSLTTTCHTHFLCVCHPEREAVLVCRTGPGPVGGAAGRSCRHGPRGPAAVPTWLFLPDAHRGINNPVGRGARPEGACCWCSFSVGR